MNPAHVEVVKQGASAIKEWFVKHRTSLKLRGANLQRADLQGADLRGADLRGADLRDADLRDADLQSADLRGAYLRGAYLRGAYLRGADLTGVIVSSSAREIIVELLRQAAGTDVPRLMLAGLIAVTPTWCWNDYLNIEYLPQKPWAIAVLKANESLCQILTEKGL